MRSLLPFLVEVLENLAAAEIITCVGIYLALAFLLPAMLRMRKRYFTALWLDKVSNRVLLLVLMVLRMGAAVVLAVVPAVVIFQVNPWWMAAAALPVIWMATHSQTPGRAVSGAGSPVFGQF